tara:strand:+ start:309 stop:440 length:132 start_codon:yes stop_codon:yes gene_type:complete
MQNLKVFILKIHPEYDASIYLKKVFNNAGFPEWSNGRGLRPLG